jgi:uncharacterized protein (DUF2236 family)
MRHDIAQVSDFRTKEIPDFVGRESIVRTIWSNVDTILLIFAGSAAEFALNRAVDWLFFTGKLPNDPIGRFFSTVRYAQEIVFADEITARQAIARIKAVHGSVERRRGLQIPDWANRDVLYMLIDYSERSYQLLHRPLTSTEQEEVFDVFWRVGRGLGIPDLPESYATWKLDRERHLEHDLVRSQYTDALYRRYRGQIGAWRYMLLLQIQAAMTPPRVRQLLSLPPSLLVGARYPYHLLNQLGLRSTVQHLLVPQEYHEKMRQLDQAAGTITAPGVPSMS